jgi:phage head maturation protease
LYFCKECKLILCHQCEAKEGPRHPHAFSKAQTARQFEHLNIADISRIEKFMDGVGHTMERGYNSVIGWFGAKNEEDKNKKLNGLLIYGYETKFADGTNENGERFSKDALDKFLESYYVKRKLNMPLTCMHGYKREDQIGRVLIIEVNSVGFYFVCYIPKGIDGYDDIKLKIQEGILQGLSKEGWSTKGKIFRDPKTGDFSYYLVEEMEMLGVSLVTTPANGNPLEKAKEIKNGLQFIKRQDNAPEVDAFGAMFN